MAALYARAHERYTIVYIPRSLSPLPGLCLSLSLGDDSSTTARVAIDRVGVRCVFEWELLLFEISR